MSPSIPLNDAGNKKGKTRNSQQSPFDYTIETGTISSHRRFVAVPGSSTISSPFSLTKTPRSTDGNEWPSESPSDRLRSKLSDARIRTPRTARKGKGLIQIPLQTYKLIKTHTSSQQKEIRQLRDRVESLQKALKLKEQQASKQTENQSRCSVDSSTFAGKKQTITTSKDATSKSKANDFDTSKNDSSEGVPNEQLPGNNALLPSEKSFGKEISELKAQIDAGGHENVYNAEEKGAQLNDVLSSIKQWKQGVQMTLQLLDSIKMSNVQITNQQQNEERQFKRRSFACPETKCLLNESENASKNLDDPRHACNKTVAYARKSLPASKNVQVFEDVSCEKSKNKFADMQIQVKEKFDAMAEALKAAKKEMFENQNSNPTIFSMSCTNFQEMESILEDLWLFVEYVFSIADQQEHEISQLESALRKVEDDFHKTISHQNHNQKIFYHMQIKTDCQNLRHENRELRQALLGYQNATGRKSDGKPKKELLLLLPNQFTEMNPSRRRSNEN